MNGVTVNEDQILSELHHLQKDRWPEVLDFISNLRHRTTGEPQKPETPTALDLAQSDLVGLWADRQDIVNTLDYARRLRDQAEHRRANDHASA
jgi:hypothetical protein